MTVSSYLVSKVLFFNLFQYFSVEVLTRLFGVRRSRTFTVGAGPGVVNQILGRAMKTFTAKPADVEKKWVVIDAEGAIVGRLAAYIATRLRGKHRPDYTPYVDTGDHVIVINAGKVVFTGRKYQDKRYYRHTGYPGGIKETSPRKVLEGRFPERVLEMAVKRMLPKESPLARGQFAKLRVYAGTEHPHEAQNPEVVDFKSRNPKNARS